MTGRASDAAQPSGLDERDRPIVQGYVDPQSGVRCGWANGAFDCAVPDCDFPEERCVCVKRERGEA